MQGLQIVGALYTSVLLWVYFGPFKEVEGGESCHPGGRVCVWDGRQGCVIVSFYRESPMYSRGLLGGGGQCLKCSQGLGSTGYMDQLQPAEGVSHLQRELVGVGGRWQS